VGFAEGVLTTAIGATVVNAAVIVAAGCWTGVVAGFVDVAALLDVLVHPATNIIAIPTIRREKRVIFLMVSF
jgi:hypothetical protein